MSQSSNKNHYKIIVIGASAGGLNAITTIIKGLPDDFVVPIVIVQHMMAANESGSYLATHLKRFSSLMIKEVDEKESIEAGCVYIAPGDFHLLIENDRTFGLSVDEKVNYVRPAVNVLFESAVDVYGGDIIGIILTGANDDGAIGLKKISEAGGVTIVQDPEKAEANNMPMAAIKIFKPDYIVPLEKISNLLIKLTAGNENG